MEAFYDLYFSNDSSGIRPYVRRKRDVLNHVRGYKEEFAVEINNESFNPDHIFDQFNKQMRQEAKVFKT